MKGVLWNDVKADHIFWDDKSNSIMVIDWGNGVILNDHRSNALWQLDFLDDYKQMIQEFDRLISSTAPELLWDLGWPQGTLKELDQNAITLLRKRVEFADNYFNLRIIEYHAKVKLLLNKMDSMEALSELIEYVNHLTQIGEIVDYPKILEAAKKLLLLYSQQGNIQDCESILTQVSKLSVENFSTEWTILNEIFSIPEVVRHTAFPIVVENACQLNWVSLFWELGHIAAEKASAAWWDKISRSIRCSVVPTEFGGDYLIELIGEMRNDLHVKTIQSRIVDDSNFNKNELRDLSRMLSDLVAHWIEVDNNTYFGEHLLILRELLPVLDKIGVEVNPLIRSLLTNLQQIIRQLVSAWNSADFFLARQTLMTYFLWDPQFKSSPSLYSSLLKMEKWVKCAYAGPNFPQDGLTFISEMLDSLQALDNNLGTPTWLMEITKGFNEILENKTKLDIQAIQKKYELPFSWLNDERIMSLDLDQSIKFIPLSISQRKALEAFYHDLKSESNIHPSLDLIKFELPQFSLAYETLATAFDSQLFPSQQQVLLLEEVKIPAEDETNFLAAKQTLTVLNNWAKANCDGSFESALALLPEDSDWHIINSCRRVQIKWQEGVLPHLSDIKERHWNQEQYRHNNLEDQD
ncbi:MAG: hypothetical protein MUO40_00420, partial [Anaerolineaceae bacterium]|nr:hypothetical protein [Anaerolineaceae bacterium]